MRFNKLAIIAATAFAAIGANANVVPLTPGHILSGSFDVTGGHFADTIDFSLANSGDVEAILGLLKVSGGKITSYNFSLTKDGLGSVWTDAQSNFSKSSYTTSFSSDDLGTFGAGTYHLSLTGTTAANYVGKLGYGITVSPVPEPETYALLGLGIVGLIARRRMQRK